ncbi:MAG: futalosine hydrolase [Desulfobacterales bacterium]|nr:futalosine hydrolase [Desulfobacterales bacterium]
MKKQRNTFQNLDKDKQERIARVAIEEFGSQGYAGASINTMVKRLNIAKGSIFQYFGDKRGLFWFVFQRSVDMVKAYLKEVRDQSKEDDFATRLKKTLNAGVRFINAHPLIYRLYLRVFFESRAPFRDEILASLRHYSLAYLTRLLEDARANGELRKDIDMRKSAFILDAVMDRFLQANMMRHLDGGLGLYGMELKGADQWIDGLVDTLVQGIGGAQKIRAKIPTPSVLILAAVQAEVKGLIRRIRPEVKSTVAGKEYFFGLLDGVAVGLLITGPGLVNAAQSLTAVIWQAPPEFIIQTGWGGAFSGSGLEPGDMAIATEEIDAHLGTEPIDGSRGVDELPFELFSIEGNSYKNRQLLDDRLVKKAFAIVREAFKDGSSRVFKGPFVTVSTITATDDTADRLYNRFHPCMEQMEGAAAAQVAHVYGIPFLEIRSVSNMVGERDRRKWDTEGASNNLVQSICSIISNKKNLI